MKKLYTSLLFILLLSFQFEARATKIKAIADTLGQARLVKSLSATMCSKIEEEEKKRPLKTLTPEEGKTLFIQIVTATMSEHTDQLSSLMTTNKIGKGKMNAVGEVLGREATMRLMKTCPASQPLVMQLGLSEAKNKPTITPEEKPVLTVLVDDICNRLDTEQAKATFAQLTPSARLEIMQQCMQGAILKHLEELSIFYGIKTVQSSSEMEKIGVKIAFIMAEQCPNHLTKMGLDSNESKGKK
ncbi:hypothetical protein GCM10011375_07900 [Hymenobacter qilianensis]|uniref:Uncharacterized protein n=2 Tax=Hymenobacter qilianensis TaxID=1385715 RepID=A0ACB5PN41_9BACT|nr:hypothetical protein [Hymenobacter qilianensis]QNP53581.1 hypothetical protein H9L05_08505 [Hymenobacter qilianensis]GGF55000.1 hypothetical protein GCM10011375_07900 [Hymenobacter qilianensis]